VTIGPYAAASAATAAATASVYIIKDLRGKEIVCGPGVTMTKSIMEMAQRMNILASARIADDIRTLRPEYETILHLPEII